MVLLLICHLKLQATALHDFIVANEVSLKQLMVQCGILLIDIFFGDVIGLDHKPPMFGQMQYRFFHLRTPQNEGPIGRIYRIKTQRR